MRTKGGNSHEGSAAAALPNGKTALKAAVAGERIGSAAGRLGRPPGHSRNRNGSTGDQESSPGAQLPNAAANSSDTAELHTYAQIDQQRLIQLAEVPGQDAADFGGTLNDVADDAFDREARQVIAEIATLPQVDAEVRDAQRNLKRASGRRALTTRMIRVRVEPVTADLEQERPANRLQLPDSDKVFVWFATLFLIASLAFLLFTGSQLILTERIYPAIKNWWEAVLVTGAIQAGCLLVPLTLARGIAMSRLQLLYRLSINFIAIGCALLLFYWLWRHGDVSATRSLSARSGAVDLSGLAAFSLDLSNIEGKARLASIVGEAAGAIAVKLNIDHLRGAHLKWKLVPNPEREEREQEVARLRERLKELNRRRALLALAAARMERSRDLNRKHFRAWIESWFRDQDAEMHRQQRALRQEVLRHEP